MAAANGHLPVVKYLILLLEKDDVKQLLEAKEWEWKHCFTLGILQWAFGGGWILGRGSKCRPIYQNNSGHDCIYEAELGGQTEVENWYLKKFTPEDAFDVQENEAEGTTKITYQPGKESKLADDQARDAVFKSKLDNTSTEGDSLEQKTQALNIDEQ